MSKSNKKYLKQIKTEDIKMDLSKPSCFFCLGQKEPFFIVEFKETSFQGYRICNNCHNLYDSNEGRKQLQFIVDEFERTRKEIIKKHGISTFDNIQKDVDENLDEYFKGKSE